MINGGFYNISFIINGRLKASQNNILYVLSKKDCNRKIEINIEELLKKYSLDDVYFLQNQKADLNYDKEIKDFKLKYNQLSDSISAYFMAIQLGCKYGFEKSVIKDVTILHPFIRLSNVDNYFVYTFFTEIHYFNNIKVFWVTEIYPDDATPVDSIDELFETINNLLTDIRRSTWRIPNTIYSYYENESEEFVTNYILKEFVYQNFGINLDNLKGKLGLVSIGKWSPNIKTTRSDKTSVVFDESTLFIGQLPHKETYKEYITKALGNLFFYESLRSMYTSFKNLTKKRNLSDLDASRKQIIANYLYSIKKGEKLDFSEDVNLLIKSQKKYDNIDLLTTLSRIAGAFSNEFTKPYLMECCR